MILTNITLPAVFQSSIFAIVKYAIPILLIFVVLLQSTPQSIVFFEYFINAETITTKFCENKIYPQLNRHGNCHLIKELAKEEKQEEQLPATEVLIDVWSYKAVKEHFYRIFQEIGFEYHILLFSGKPSNFFNPFFHPPPENLTVFLS